MRPTFSHSDLMESISAFRVFSVVASSGDGARFSEAHLVMMEDSSA